MKTSRLEKLFEELLIIENISYTKQFRLENKLFDFKISDKFLVEVDGDFFHANPNKWPTGPIHSIQINTVKNDKQKNEIATNNGYTLIRVWEEEFNDLDTLRRKILGIK